KHNHHKTKKPHYAVLGVALGLLFGAALGNVSIGFIFGWLLGYAADQQHREAD
ncbi:MAG: hypothetical protein GY803_24680, partial [Chloroflexi bacterium]|nr:hypothetical protein [Chloroflexota bacterium]